MKAQRLSIDYLNSNKFVVIDNKYQTESVIHSIQAHKHYAFDTDKYYFTQKAKDELENQIEEAYEQSRKEESSKTPDAAA